MEFDGTDDKLDSQQVNRGRLGASSGTDNNVEYSQEAWFGCKKIQQVWVRVDIVLAGLRVLGESVLSI